MAVLRVISTISFSGGLDISRYPEIVDAFRKHVEGAEPLIVDLSAATWIDSVFIAELLIFRRRNTRPERTIILVAGGNVARMLTIVGIDKKIPVVSTLEEAKELVAVRC
jgi:anti-anti-sigma factor